MVVSEFILKCCLREAFTRSPNQYKEYLVEFWYTAKVLKDSTKVWFSTPTGGIKGDVGANYIAHSKDYVAPPSIETVRDWFPTIGYGGAIKATGTLKKGLLPPRWRLLMAQIIRWQDWDMELMRSTLTPLKSSVSSITKPVAFKAPETSSKYEKKLPKAYSLELKLDEGGNQPLHQQSTILLPQQQDKTQSVRDELEIVQTKAGTDKDEFNTSPDLSRSDDATKEIKLEDLSKLVKDVDVDFMDLYSPKYDEPIIIEDNEDEEVHAEAHKETEDTSIPETPLSPKTIKIQELSTKFLLLQSPNLKLEKEKAKVEAEVAFLSAQPSYPNVEQLTELVKSLQPELSKLLTNHDFCASIPTKLKEPPSKFNEIIGEFRDLKKY
ncbi:hypothetical protein Tco_0272607, partial [Tanacetum coccineum]